MAKKTKKARSESLLNRHFLTGVLVGIVIAVIGCMAYNRFVLAPAQTAQVEVIIPAQDSLPYSN